MHSSWLSQTFNFSAWWEQRRPSTTYLQGLRFISPDWRVKDDSPSQQVLTDAQHLICRRQLWSLQHPSPNCPISCTPKQNLERNLTITAILGHSLQVIFNRIPEMYVGNKQLQSHSKTRILSLFLISQHSEVHPKHNRQYLDHRL